MVIHTWNSCSAFNPSKVHTHSSEHTPWTHTRSSGQPFILRYPGSSCGFMPCSRAPRRGIEDGENAVHLQFLPAWDSNSQPFDYESDSLLLGHDFPLLTDNGWMPLLKLKCTSCLEICVLIISVEWSREQAGVRSECWLNSCRCIFHSLNNSLKT